MSSFKNKWHSMSSRKKQVLIVGGLITTVVLGAVMFGESGTSTFNHDNDDDDTSVNVFSTNRAREAGIDGLSSQVRSLAEKNRQLEDKLAGIQATNKRFNEALQNSDSEAAIGVALSDIRDEVVGLKRENKDLKSQLNIIDDEPFGLPLSRGDSGGEEYQEDEYQEVTSGGIPVAKAPPDASQTTGEDEAQEKAKEKKNVEAWTPDEEEESSPYDYSVTANPMAKSASPAARDSSESESSFGSRDNESGGASGGSQISTITQYVAPVEELDIDENDTYLTAGSIVSGVLITGMDAPTGSGARKDPFPATLRINKEAILPNRFRADVRECFMLISGQGDLSSERAYLRGETISCVREDGGIIETGIKGYATGEDGKAGIRGRLVSKQGAIIAKSLMAGFMSGAAEAFDVNPIPIIETGNTSGQNSYTSNYSPDALQGAVSKGASNALDRIAQFYIDMAEGMYPVIEISAGRQIDFIVTSATKLKVKG